MIRFALFLVAAPLLAQDSLSLRDAVRLALRENKGLAASSAAVDAARARVDQARGGRLPKLNYSESWSAGNNPVYVFGSLLTQHQFTVENLNIGTLNRPDPLNNFQSLVTIDQPIYDAGQTHTAVKSATLARELSAEDKRRAEMQIIAGVLRAYYGATLAAESLKSAEHALRSAEADLKRAEDVRAAGMATDADVLSLRVHLAGVTEQRIQRAADLDVARAELNDVLGAPLDAPHVLTTALAALDVPDMTLEALEKQGSTTRPEARQSRLAADLARVQADAARSAYLPEVMFHGAWEVDRQRFITRGGANWLTSIGLRWNLFNGNSDKARVRESTYAIDVARADEQRVDSAVRLEVRRACAALSAAGHRIEVARAAADEAEESLRITQNRYEAGMTTVTDLLRNETAVLESRTRYLSAIHDQRLAAAALQLAAGSLTPDSEVLN
ncbi:MAG TPA: TolC family protein [Candidatus Limnocylindrales bacterium]|nr:TolC family protein [Candidatus Limnocylindrales bacterium]